MRGRASLLGAILVGLATAAPAGGAVDGVAAPHPASAPAPHGARAGALLDPSAAEVSPQALRERAAEADFVLIGESHLSRCDHRTQARLIAQLAEGGLRPTIGLEMVAVDQQRVLDLFNARRIPAARMGAALDWEFYWGFDFALYRPIFEVAERHDLPVVALNIPARTARIIADREIPLDRIAPERLVPPRVLPPPPEQLASLVEEYEAHAAMLPETPRRPFTQLDGLDRFLLVQSLWDTKMAQEAVRARSRLGRPVVVLAGTGHVERGWGIASRLRQFFPAARILTIVPTRGERPLDPKAAELFYECPRAHAPVH